MRVLKVRKQPEWKCAAVAAVAVLLWASASTAALGQDNTESLHIKPPFAWNRTDRYEPPNYEAFFPDDVEGGKQLDLLIEGKLKPASVDERLAVIRRGLRNTTHHRTTLLGSVGNEFVWNKDEQDPRAIELMYHASVGTDSGVAHYALYHGPTVVSQRTPNLVRMLMEQYQGLAWEIRGRIAWGMKKYGDQEQTRKLLLDLLDDHEQLDEAAICAAVHTYQAVFEEAPPDMARFDAVGKWVIAFHRTDLSADHPRAAEILRESVEKSFRTREERLLDFVTRVDGTRETAVVLVQGMGPRADLSKYLSRFVTCRIDFDEMLSPRVLQERRLREFARYLPDGLPKHARPAYTRPPADMTYAHQAEEFIAPAYQAFFADDVEAGKQLAEVYDNRDSVDLSDGELLDLFRRGARRCEYPANTMFGWISGTLGWPTDPRLTEILYQGMGLDAPSPVRKASIYYGFGLGTTKTKNILTAMHRVYMAPPFDRITNGNMRQRILWGVRDHEDDKHYLATRFEESLRDHAALSDIALQQAQLAYQQLTGEEPPNAADYASRGVFLVLCHDKYSRSIDESKQRMAERLGDSEDVIETKYFKENGQIMVVAAVRGAAGMKWIIDNWQAEPKMTIYFADMLTRELIEQAQKDIWREFEKHLPDER